MEGEHRLGTVSRRRHETEGGRRLDRAQNSPGLAYVEKAATGGYIVANASPTDGSVTVTLGALKGMKAFALDEDEQRAGPADVRASGNSFAVDLKAGAKVEFAPESAQSIFAYRTDMLQKRAAAQEAALAKAKDDCVARTKVAESEAKAHPAPANTILVVNAAAFTGQGAGEEVGVATISAASSARPSRAGTPRAIGWSGPSTRRRRAIITSRSAIAPSSTRSCATLRSTALRRSRSAAEHAVHRRLVQ